MARIMSDGLNIHALKDFGFKCRNVVREKSYFVCNTDKGIKNVRKITTSNESVKLQHAVKETLYENGFVNIDRFILSVNGMPYVTTDNDIYVATEQIPSNYKEVNFQKKSEFLEVIKAVATMHLILKKHLVLNKTVLHDTFDSNMRTLYKYNASNVYDKLISDIKRYKKIIEKQPRLSDFDVMFIKNNEFYISCIDNWYKTAVKDEYAGIMDEGYSNKYICHNLLKEDTLYKASENDIFITDFSECSISHFINDLVIIIRRYIKIMPTDMLPLSKILESYNDINPLTKSELQALRALLIFPDKFIKLCSKYYSKKRTWIPATFLDRMDTILKNKQKYMEYIDEIY